MTRNRPSGSGGGSAYLGGAAADHEVAVGAADLAGAADGVEQPAVRMRIGRRRVGDVGCHVGDAGGLPYADTTHNGETAARGTSFAIGADGFIQLGNFPS